jgi:hypothetical protein
VAPHPDVRSHPPPTCTACAVGDRYLAHAPTDTNGTQSRPTARFTPLQPVSSSPSQYCAKSATSDDALTENHPPRAAATAHLGIDGHPSPSGGADTPLGPLVKEEPAALANFDHGAQLTRAARAANTPTKPPTATINAARSNMVTILCADGELGVSRPEDFAKKP